MQFIYHLHQDNAVFSLCMLIHRPVESHKCFFFIVDRQHCVVCFKYFCILHQNWTQMPRNATGVLSGILKDNLKSYIAAKESNSLLSWPMLLSNYKPLLKYSRDKKAGLERRLLNIGVCKIGNKTEATSLWLCPALILIT